MLENKTLTELNSMTKAQIIASIISERPSTNETCTKLIDCKNGQVLREFVTKDMDGNIIKTDVWEWKYKKDGSVDTIDHKIINVKGIVTRSETITHSTDVEVAK